MFVQVDDGSYVNIDNIIRISRPINGNRRVECVEKQNYFICENTFNSLRKILDIRDTNKQVLEQEHTEGKSSSKK